MSELHKSLLKLKFLEQTGAPEPLVAKAATELHKHAHSALNDFRKEHSLKVMGPMKPREIMKVTKSSRKYFTS